MSLFLKEEEINLEAEKIDVVHEVLACLRHLFIGDVPLRPSPYLCCRRLNDCGISAEAEGFH